MTDSQLHKLHRQELLEILFEMRKELDALRNENESLKKQLADRENVTAEMLELVRKTAEDVRVLRYGEADKCEGPESSNKEADACGVNVE